MADTKASALTNYPTPTAGGDLLYIVDTTNSASKNITLAQSHFEVANGSTSNQTGFAADTYLTGSNILIPAGGPYVDTKYLLVFDMTKTGAGVATPIVTLRIGTAGTTSDAAICVFTFAAGTAAADTGTFQVEAIFRTVGSSTSAVLQGVTSLTSNLTTTGLSNAVKVVKTTSSGFNSTTANSIIGVSFNGGTSFSGTNTLVRAELML